MKKYTVIDLSVQNVDYRELIPQNSEIVLAPKCNINEAMTNSWGDLMLMLRKFIKSLEMTTSFSIHDPVFVILNSTPQGFASAIMIYGYFSAVNTTVNLWVLRNENDGNGRYLSLDQSYMEGMDMGRTRNNLENMSLSMDINPV